MNTAVQIRADVADAPNDPPRAKQALRLWLKLLGATTAIEKHLRLKIAREFGLTLPRFDVLSALARAEADGLSMGSLSKTLRVSNGNVTGIVERLIEDGLVERRQTSADRRTSVVRLTATGAEAFAAMAKAHEGWVEAMFAHLTAKEIAACLAALSQIRDGVSNHPGMAKAP